jgi:hypothetical protein
MANDARLLWRETPMHDVGIDGHVEYVTKEYANPVVLILYNPGSDEMFWADARRSLRAANADSQPISVSSKLETESFLDMFESGGPLPTTPMGSDLLLQQALNGRSGSDGES